MSKECKPDINLKSEDRKVRRQDWAVIVLGILLMGAAKVFA